MNEADEHSAKKKKIIHARVAIPCQESSMAIEGRILFCEVLQNPLRCTRKATSFTNAYLPLALPK
jgi:hypothetical protein